MYDSYYYELLNIYKPLIEHNKKNNKEEVVKKYGQENLWSARFRQKYNKK